MAANDRLRSSVDILTKRLSLIRALYVVSLATNGDRSEIMSEFYQAVADILEGVAMPQLKLRLIDAAKVKEESAWLRDKGETDN